MKTIEITVSPTGDTSVEAMGFKGADCEQATRFIEEALGQNAKITKKPEYYQALRTGNQQKVGQ